MKKFFSFVVVAFLAVAMASIANASLIEQSFSFTNQTFNTPQSYNLFDTNLGVLNSVKVSMSFNDLATMSVENNRDFAMGFTEAQVYVDITARFSNLQLPMLRVESTKTGYFGPLDPFTTMVFSDVEGSGNRLTDISQNQWSLFSALGGGNSMLNATAIRLGGALFDDEGGTVSSTGFTNGSIKLTYDYNAVPIPAAVWLLGTGIVGLAGLRRKVQK